MITFTTNGGNFFLDILWCGRFLLRNVYFEQFVDKQTAIEKKTVNLKSSHELNQTEHTHFSQMGKY